jgi:glycosyltransferase involved in cell wall biosynthesis
MQTPTQSQPIVSIGMPVFNCAGTVARAICSILNQTFVAWELLISDDGSTDNTLGIAASFDDPRIIVSRGEKNEGLPERLNECVSRARGKYFARMDGDDIAYPERLKRQLEFLQSHPDVDLVGGWVVVFRKDGTAFGVRRGPVMHEQICAHPWKVIPIAHPTWVGKTEWFQRNPYRTDAPRTQDQDLLLRSHRESRFAIVPKIVLGYREESLSLSKILLARRDMVNTMVRIAIEQHRFATAALGIAALLFKGMVDTIAICTGLKYRLLRYRALTISNEDEIEWQSVWEQVSLTFNRLESEKTVLANPSQGSEV